MKKLLTVMLFIGALARAQDTPAVSGKAVSFANARQTVGVSIPDQFFIVASGLNPTYKQVRITVRYSDQNGTGQFVANADITNGVAVLPMSIADASTFVAKDIWLDYGNTTTGYDYPQL
jgi:hypothetical protein